MPLCRGHEWVPLYERPLPESDIEIRLDFQFLAITSRVDEYYRCTKCDCLGSRLRGFRRGGGHALKSIWGGATGHEDDKDNPSVKGVIEYKTSAAAWNAKLAASEEKRRIKEQFA